MNWKIKAGIQWILGRAPFGRGCNYLLQLLSNRHNPGKKAKRAAAMLKRLHKLNSFVEIQGAVVLEVGTGWDALNAVAFHLLGAKAVYTFDHVPHLRVPLVRALAEAMAPMAAVLSEACGISAEIIRARCAAISACDSISDLAGIGIHYSAPADASKSGLEARSVDIFCSIAVLEHVPYDVLARLTDEARRVLRPGGVCFHEIGLADHYIDFDKRISGVNFLTISDSAWDFWVNNPGIGYHNRLREKDFLKHFKERGMRVLSLHSETSDSDLAAAKTLTIDARFSQYTPDELAVSKTVVTLAFDGPNSHI